MLLLIRLVGALQPPPDALVRLHLTDCELPCWLGIIPGETPFDEALRRVIATYPDDVSVTRSEIAINYQAGRASGLIRVEADGRGTVNRIFFSTANVEGVTVGDVVSWHGSPACSVLVRTVQVYGSADTFAVVVGTARLGERWREPLSSISILSYGTFPCAAPSLTRR